MTERGLGAGAALRGEQRTLQRHTQQGLRKFSRVPSRMVQGGCSKARGKVLPINRVLFKFKKQPWKERDR